MPLHKVQKRESGLSPGARSVKVEVKLHNSGEITPLQQSCPRWRDHFLNCARPLILPHSPTPKNLTQVQRIQESALNSASLASARGTPAFEALMHEVRAPCGAPGGSISRFARGPSRPPSA